MRRSSGDCEIGQGAGLKLNNEAELAAAAGKISELGKKFSSAYDGSEFAAMTNTFLGSSHFKGQGSNSW